MFAKLSVAALFLSAAVAVPASTLESRALDTAQRCGQWDSVVAAPYKMWTNLWGAANDKTTSGSQCSQLTSLSGTSIAWKTTWQWTAGTGGIKSYSNIQLDKNVGSTLAAIKSIPSTWKWSQTATNGNVVTNVAYDLFTANTFTGPDINEIMIWMANVNAGPISYNYGSDGKPVAVRTNLNINGVNWNLYHGTNGHNIVFSFLPVSGTVTSYSGDINLFLKYLTSSGYMATSQILKTFQAGTEPTKSDKAITLTTSQYSAVINL